jgi:hypothetical protein
MTSAGASAGLLGPAIARASSPGQPASNDKRRSLYQPRSAEVQTFYRVNRYPAK